MQYKGKKFRWPLAKSELEYLYGDEKLTYEVIASLAGTSAGNVCSLRKKYLIPKIESWQRKNLPLVLSQEEKEVVLGYLLGDGYIGFSAKEAHLAVNQCKKQKLFVEQVFSYLSRWAAHPIRDGKKSLPCSDKQYSYLRFNTIQHPVFSELRRLCYVNGVKTVTSTWLSYIGSLGLALWYEGDGGLSGGRVNGSPVISTCAFSLAEHRLIVDWLEAKFAIESHIINNGRYRCIYIDSRSRFRDIIEPYIVDCFKYKLPMPKKILERHVYEGITSLLATGATNRKIARMQNVSEWTVGRIALGKTYKRFAK